MREWVKAVPLGLGVPVVIGAASVKPEEAASNLAAWAHFLGVHDVPPWLKGPGVDGKVIAGTAVVSAVYAFLVWGIPAIRHHTHVPAQPEPQTRIPATATNPAIEPQPARSREEDDKTILGITAQYLMSLYDAHTIIQGDKLTEPFRGKWIEITHAVFNVGLTAIGRHAFIAFYLDNNTRLVFMTFEPEWINRLSIITIGQTITVRGKIDIVQQTQLHLSECELVAFGS
jgi:hypothetical protein